MSDRPALQCRMADGMMDGMTARVRTVERGPAELHSAVDLGPLQDKAAATGATAPLVQHSSTAAVALLKATHGPRATASLATRVRLI
jgi:hypothetical protein